MRRELVTIVVVLAALMPSCKESPETPTPPSAPATPATPPDTIQLLAPKRMMEAGEKIEASDLEVFVVETHFREAFGSNFIVGVNPSELDGEELSQRKHRGRFLSWDDILGHGTVTPSSDLEPGTESFQIAIQPLDSPGRMLSVGDRVVLMGALALSGKSAKTYRIIEGAKVVSVGGMTMRPWPIGGRTRSGTVAETPDYRTIGLQVTPDTAMNLHNVLTHLVGHLRVNVLSRKDKKRYVEKNILVAEELRNLPPAAPASSPK